ncbi:hypothetical protein Q3G72_001075 [Acer saccharum]|nr:hypothetical protein Q3G72_001075 [Acer saccharum]
MVKVANSLKPKAMFSPIIAEAMAVWIAADWSRDGDLGPRGECLLPVLVESNVLEVVNLINSGKDISAKAAY